MDCICAIADENFIPHFSTLFCSIAINSPGYHVILVSTGINDDSRRKLESFAAELEASLDIIDASAVDLSQLPTFGRWSKEVWLKLFLPDLVPAHFTRMLHLDCDMVVVDSVSELVEMDMQGAAIAAVPDVTINAMPTRKCALGIPDNGTYFNAGCLLVDLDAWRKKEIRARAVEYALQHREQIQFLDQDALNAVAWGDTITIGNRWNYAPGSTVVQLENPAIVHFIGKLKPWKIKNVSGASIYRHYRKMTPWPHYSIPRQYPRSMHEWRKAVHAFRYSMLGKLDLARKKLGVRQISNPEKSSIYHMELNRPLFDRLYDEQKNRYIKRITSIAG